MKTTFRNKESFACMKFNTDSTQACERHCILPLISIWQPIVVPRSSRDGSVWLAPSLAAKLSSSLRLREQNYSFCALELH
mmetsp:Transcript_26439/g.40156  ORF Transcript_26439/g.40156 Transcript_26439/m.40156 type:complete len:80 (+) Transcript_26439:81-320(+)|eukprot:CAMPEP_0195034426 /NCGR_PEP_ID=MMETSP0326_2-20130528/67834_1 /TAXON_ID=2866 ORGANISM="Crypthecodinium cohnii, Strain Seligo" /NCGR_SAMPLE_ID=MMETSP0326_2 /ASSEMBLY_ACC=CAM_ASM_000348 /LENGTH=79 /DNA_ID=CAMNT_0040059251 /DNA_START=34 /DNA_END=273 /DNA_ORIENTATION=-